MKLSPARTAGLAVSWRSLAALGAAPKGWWWIFGLLIAAPALALSLLGLRAARLDDVERDEEARQHLRHIATLADAALGNMLQSLEHDLTRFDIAAADRDPSGLRLMTYDRRGHLLFPNERVFFADDFTRPIPAAPAPRSQLVESLLEEALAADAQRHSPAALPLLRSVAAREPSLAEWARLQSARIQVLSGNAAAITVLSDPGWSRSSALTPTQLPVAFLACAFSGSVAPVDRRRFVPLLEQTLANVRSGRWWLSFDEREFHDGELRRLMSAAGLPLAADDPVLDELTTVRELVRNFPPARRDMVARSSERARGRTFLLLWAADPDAAQRWRGLTASSPDRLIDAVVRPLLSGSGLDAALLDVRGDVVWSSKTAQFRAVRMEALRAIPGWSLGFSDFTNAGANGQRKLLWYALVVLLMIMLLAGTTMTVRTVRREVALGRLQSDFVAAVSHEFKSPLTSIGLHMERLLGGRVASQDLQNEYFRTIAQDADRLQRLVDRLLDSQQIQAGSKTYVLEPGSLDAVAATVVERLRPLADARQIRLELRNDSGNEDALFDRRALTDAVDNLVENAIKYSKPGGDVRIMVRETQDGVEVEVSDSGIGIDPEDLPRIFEKFYRGRRSNTHDVRGTGLGLSLVQAIAVAHQGRVTVASTPGHGSRFTLQLPKARRV
ncbi:MAG: sensor histidine kinase [Bacteroidales bacterium]